MKSNNREYLIMIISGTLTMFSGGFVWPIFAAYVRTEFSAPLQLVGLAVSGYFLLRMLAEFPIGVLSDSIGPKTPIIAGRVLAVVAAFISFQTRSVALLICARLVWGIGDASFFCIGTSYVSKLFSSERRGKALGVFQAVEMAGNLLGQAVGGFFADRYGLRMNFLASAIMAAVALIMVTFIKGRTGKPNVFAGKISSLIPSWKKIRRILNREVLVICMVNLVAMVVMNGVIGTIMPIYSIENIGLSLSQYAFLVSLSTIGNISGNLAGGIFSDKFGRKKILLAGFIIGIMAIFGLSLAGGFLSFAFAMFFTGIFWGTVYGVVPAFIADTVPTEMRGVGIGVYRTFLDLGGLTGPVIVSAIAGSFGGVRGYLFSFYFCIILIAGLIGLTAPLKEKKPVIEADEI